MPSTGMNPGEENKIRSTGLGFMILNNETNPETDNSEMEVETLTNFDGQIENTNGASSNGQVEEPSEAEHHSSLIIIQDYTLK